MYTAIEDKLKALSEQVEKSIAEFFDEASKTAENLSKEYAEFENRLKAKELELQKEGNIEEIANLNNEVKEIDGLTKPVLHPDTEGFFEEPDGIPQTIVTIKESIDTKHKNVVGKRHIDY
jgi:molybdopterin converting factor small subunit